MVNHTISDILLGYQTTKIQFLENIKNATQYDVSDLLTLDIAYPSQKFSKSGQLIQNIALEMFPLSASKPAFRLQLDLKRKKN